MKTKISSVIQGLNTSNDEIEETFNAGVIDGFNKQSFTEIVGQPHCFCKLPFVPDTIKCVHGVRLRSEDKLAEIFERTRTKPNT